MPAPSTKTRPSSRDSQLSNGGEAAANLPAKAEPSAPNTSHARLISLDAFRGFTMFWIVGGKSFVMALQGLQGNEVAALVAHELSHSAWEGLRYYDVIWPSFMLMVGVSIALSFAKHRQTQSRRRLMTHVLKRSAVLFLLGSLRTSIELGSPTLVELSSALQPIAIAYLITSFLALYADSAKLQAAVGGLILVAHALLLALASAPGSSGSNYEQGANIVAVVDIAVLGRTHPEGWGTVLTAVPPTATTILGLLIGQLLISGSSMHRKMAVMGLIGIGCLLAGYAMSPLVPVIMKLWTSSYGILSAGWSCLLFLLFFWIIDARSHRKWAFPFVVIGMNALAIYIGVSVVPVRKIVGIFSSPIGAHLGALGPLFSAFAVVAVEWMVLYWMYNRKIFIRA